MGTQQVQIGMLGPLEVRTHDGAPVDVPGVRLRAAVDRPRTRTGPGGPEGDPRRLDLGRAPTLRRGQLPATHGVPSTEGAAGRVGRVADGRLPVGGGARRGRRGAVRAPRRAGAQRGGSLAGAAAARGPRTVAWCGHAGSRSARQRRTCRGGDSARGVAPDCDGGSVRGGGQPRPRCGADRGAHRRGGRSPLAGTACRGADACPGCRWSRDRGAARVRAHEGGPRRRLGRQPVAGAVVRCTARCCGAS